MSSEQILQFIGELGLYGGSSAGIAFLIFRFLGKTWINSVFKERLEKHKHDLEIELDQHRYKINTLFNRITKIHEKEFEVLPESWLKMQDAIGDISRVVSIIKSSPDLDRMGENEFEEFVAKSRLHDHEKKEILKSSQKTSYYQKACFWHDINDAEKAFWEFHNYIIRNKIFLSVEIQEHFSKIDDIMHRAIIEMGMGEESNDPKMRIAAYKKIRDNVNPIRDKIAELVQSRLHYNDAN